MAKNALNDTIVALLLNNQNSGTLVYKHFSNYKTKKIRKMVAECDNTPMSILVKLENDNEKIVSIRAKENIRKKQKMECKVS